MKALTAFALGTLFGATALWLSLPRLDDVDLVGYANRVLSLSTSAGERNPRTRPAAESGEAEQRAIAAESSAHTGNPFASGYQGVNPRPQGSPPCEPLAPDALRSEPSPQNPLPPDALAPEPTAINPPQPEPMSGVDTPNLDPTVPRPEGLAATMPAAVLTPSNLLGMPIAGIAASQLRDDFTDPRGEGRGHEAIDIAAPLGTPVLAVDAGRVVKLFTSERGGLTVYQFDASEELAYYYAHLDHYAAGLAEGQQLKRGDLIGYVGYTGNANSLAPHLHFAIFLLGPEKQWWKGTAIDPYSRLGGQ